MEEIARTLSLREQLYRLYLGKFASGSSGLAVTGPFRRRCRRTPRDLSAGPRKFVRTALPREPRIQREAVQDEQAGAAVCRVNIEEQVWTMGFSPPLQAEQEMWKNWAQALHRWGVGDWAAAFLDAAGPLAVLGAQLIYLGEPLLNGVLPQDQMQALAVLFEEPDKTKRFATYLREVPSP